MRILFDYVSIVVLATVSSLAFATPGLAVSLGDFLKAHPECREVNDGCSVCRVVNGSARGASGVTLSRKALCSTPGIACIIKGWQCVDGQPLKPISDKPTKASEKLTPSKRGE